MMFNEKAESRDMKTLGVIGGVGPESTIDYYKNIIATYRERKADGHYPQFVINSIDLQKGIDFLEANDLAGMTAFLLGEIVKLQGAGAEFGIIAANTPHIVFDEVRARSPIPFISIVEASCDCAKARHFKRLALFGTRYTMQADFYQKVFRREGIELVVPELKDQDYIHEKYFAELVPGIFLPETRAGLLAIVDRMKQKTNIEGVLLAGTELALILRGESHNGIALLDTGKIHCHAAVNEMFS
ncbi:MAG TPA: amino acid racemase [Chthoniobacterales bacterium]|jgi:aspartate racemase|nr:amino acid racemase [Chthoniobacterales bacterium]